MEDNKRIEELIDICFRYSDAAYKLIGELNKNHLDTFEIIALNNFKKTIDSCLSGNDNYKDYLEHKYIIKDIKSIGEYVDKWAKDTNEIFVHENQEDKYEEDDTEELHIIDRKDNAKSHLKPGMTYNTRTKSFIERKSQK